MRHYVEVSALVFGNVPAVSIVAAPGLFLPLSHQHVLLVFLLIAILNRRGVRSPCGFDLHFPH